MFGNPVLGPRIVPFGQGRQSSDYLPNGRPGFRVTQRFADWDTFFRDRLHGALDIANYNCGDAVVAMEAGVVIPLADPNGAIGVEIQHSSGYRSQYWHLSRRAVMGGTVQRGRTIGYVGRTGIAIAGCHLHLVVLNPAGIPVDPWPLLNQNRPSAVTAVKFNPGVDGVYLRTSPDARKGTNVAAIAYKDPRGIVRLRDGVKIGNTSSQRRLYDRVAGADGFPYNELRINRSGLPPLFVQSRFMHVVT